MKILQILSRVVLVAMFFSCVDSRPNVVPGTGGSTGVIGGVQTGGAAPLGGAGGSLPVGTGGCVAQVALAEMKIGWNLGNSLDAIGSNRSDTDVETSWGNPIITPALIQTVAKAGFGAIRIPVTWIDRFGEAPDYTIRSTFLSRVEEVVNYVLDQNLYAIINLHHDGGKNVTGQWMNLATNRPTLQTQFQKIWAQIAEKFKGHSHRLIFESMNEIQGSSSTPTQANFDVINALNTSFVETVRRAGGNNPSRCLLVPGYNTNIDHTVKGFIAPSDSSAGRLILSVHYYDPWNYAGAGSTHVWGAGYPGIDNWGQEDWVQKQMAKLKATYIDKGIPVIMGEYGAVNQVGYEPYRRYYMEYVTKAAFDVGVVPIYWDNGSTRSGDDAFGLFNRRTNTVLYPDILEAMIRAVTSGYALADVAKP
jgi:endoglucanase